MCDDDLAMRCSAHAPISEHGRFAAGTVFGDWRTMAFIGRGGNGEVYCAEHVALGTPVAVKVLTREEERAKERFAREAKLLAEMKSKAFPRFFAYGEANGVPYLAMELLEPGELPMDDRAVAKFMLKVCDAVGELHALGYVHRDIKPDNILWRSHSEPVLADLGLVKELELTNSQLKDSQLTVGGVGTPGYGAPEQMERGEATAASDIHALGVLADRCFSGNPPRAWKRIIERATSSIPDRRYHSVSAFSKVIRLRHLTRHAVMVTATFLVPLFIVMEISNIDPRYFDFDDEPTITVRPKVRDYKMYERPLKLNDITHLDEGKSILTTPVLLEGGREYQIIGPGTLEADIFCPTAAVLRLKDCVLLNTTKRLYPENGIQYRLENGVYLNFVNIKKLPLELSSNDFIAPFDGAYNQVRFGGPDTVKELMENIFEERANDLQNWAH